jgi:hypothetical protein
MVMEINTNTAMICGVSDLRESPFMGFMGWVLN